MTRTTVKKRVRKRPTPPTRLSSVQVAAIEGISEALCAQYEALDDACKTYHETIRQAEEQANQVLQQQITVYNRAVATAREGLKAQASALRAAWNGQSAAWKAGPKGVATDRWIRDVFEENYLYYDPHDFVFEPEETEHKPDEPIRPGYRVEYPWPDISGWDGSYGFPNEVKVTRRPVEQEKEEEALRGFRLDARTRALVVGDLHPW